MGAYLSSPKKDKDCEEGENNRLRFGATTMQGWRMNQEDAHNCILNFDENCSFFAVYDGHGGPEVSKYAANNFPELVKSSEHWINSKVEKALEDSFLNFDEKLLDENVIVELKALGDIVDVEGEEDDEDKAKLMEEATLPLEQVLSRYGIQLRMKRDEFSENIVSSSDDNDVEKTLTSRKSKIVAEILEQNGHIESDTPENKEDPNHRIDGKNGHRAPLKRGINGNTLCSSFVTAQLSQTTTTTSQLINVSGDSTAVQNGSAAEVDLILPPEGKKMRLQSQLPSTDNHTNNDDDSAGECRKGKSDSTIDLSDKCHRVESSSEEVNEKNQVGDCHTLQNGLMIDDSQYVDQKENEPNLDKVLRSSIKFQTETIEIGEKGGVTTCQVSEKVVYETDNKNEACVGLVERGRVVRREKNCVKQPRVENGTVEDSQSDANDEEDEEEDDEYEDTSNDEEEDREGGREPDEDEDEQEEEEEEEDDDEDDEDEASDDFEQEIARAALENMEQFAGPSQELPGNSSGTTACVLVIKDDTIYVANAGDSRCVLCRDGQAIDLSIDHKPEDDIERKRIEAAGGAITEDGRVNGGLNLSRALGDHFYKSNVDIPLKDQMISPFPDVQVKKLTAEDSFLVLACDGIWNSMSSQAVVDFVDARLKAGLCPIKICEEICDSCLAETTVGDGTGCDNMTVIVVDLKRNIAQPDASAIGNNTPSDLDPEPADRPISPAPSDPLPVV